MHHDALLLTLGHNSSAIYVKDGVAVIGYENERLTKVKADSKFPSEAILEIRKHYTIADDVPIYVSHWVIDLEFEDTKWWDSKFVKDFFPNSLIYSLSEDFTHHDAHAYSALCFTGDDVISGSTVIVADGFGNLGEVLSIYEVTDDKRLIKRKKVFGFDKSLGLLYQYAVAFLGMKENQDEYKLLGYESNKQRLDKHTLVKLHELADEFSVTIIRKMSVATLESKFDPLFMRNALVELKSHYRHHFNKLITQLGIDEDDAMSVKIAIASYVQRAVENVMSKLVSDLKCKDLILVGGLFMNVKLNNRLSKQVDTLSIMPIAGDQGCGLGIYYSTNVDFKFPKNLFLGQRHLSRPTDLDPSILVMGGGDFTINTIATLLNAGKIVNVIQGNMEYGARSLCNTSTLAIPSDETKTYIDTVNGRDSYMPMAPVVRKEDFDKIFSATSVIDKSLKYMIAAVDLKDPRPGISCYDPDRGVYTGRPQVVEESDGLIWKLLAQIDGRILINTSLNEHGMPILFDMGDIIRCHKYQKARDMRNRIVTVIIN